MSAGPTAPFLVELGQRVRASRRQQQITVARLTELAGVSRRMLTQIELGQANPSLVTVDKIARALNTDFAGVVLASSVIDVLTVQPEGSATVMWISPAGSTALLHVVTAARGGSELWSWRLAPDDRYTAQPDPSGSEELFLVTVGVLTIHVDGLAPTQVPAGVSARLASDRQYTYANDGSELVTFVRVVVIRPH